MSNLRMSGLSDTQRPTVGVLFLGLRGAIASTRQT